MTPQGPILNPKAMLGAFLREERERLRLRQSEMAEQLGVSRSTQICYENARTEPTTGYLRNAQLIGVDVFKVLYGPENKPTSIIWLRMQQSAEAVEFFCIRNAPTCPSHYRWQMIKTVYTLMLERLPPEADQDTVLTFAMDEVEKAWDGLRRVLSD